MWLPGDPRQVSQYCLLYCVTPKRCQGPQGTTSLARKEVTALVATCEECGRVFDLLDEGDAAEYAYGHDCEVE